jgi:hypothetical protein
MNNAEIIETAALSLAVDKAPDDTGLCARFQAALDRLEGPRDGVCLMLAVKIQSGLPYRITSDNPETVRRARSIASDLGARVEFTEEGRLTSMQFTPPMKS